LATRVGTRRQEAIDQCIANLAVDAADPDRLMRELGAKLDVHAPLLGIVRPVHARQIDDRAAKPVQFHRSGIRRHVTAPVELPHTLHGLRDVVDRALDHFQLAAAAQRQHRFALEEGLDIKRDRRHGVVDVVGDAACHLAERAQPLLLGDRELALPKVFIRLLEFVGELHLTYGKTCMIAELLQEFDIAA
jgi:hypothetical protein